MQPQLPVCERGHGIPAAGRCQLHVPEALVVPALGELEKIPDVIELLTPWAAQLASEGMDFLELTRMQVAAASIYQRQVMGTVSSAETALAQDCDAYLSKVELSAKLLPFFDRAYEALAPNHSEFRKAEILAHFALRAITKCAAQT